MIFENVHLQFTGGNTASSGQIFYWNAKYCDMDTLAFRNCEISNYPAYALSLSASFPRMKMETTSMMLVKEIIIWKAVVNYFEVVDCLVHDANISSGNKWPCVYFGQVPIEVVFRNNTFYNLPYLKYVFTMGYITDETGRADGSLTFEKNTVMVGSATPHDIINVGNYMGLASEFHINNNMLLYPDWTDEYTLAPGTKKPKIIACTYGVVSAANNVIEGYDNWSTGNAKDEETGEYTWLSADTTDNYTMATAELAWDDFYDRANKDFSLLKEYKVYTLGKDS